MSAFHIFSLPVSDYESQEVFNAVILNIQQKKSYTHIHIFCKSIVSFTTCQDFFKGRTEYTRHSFISMRSLLSIQ